MHITEQLASALGRKEGPNIILAQQLSERQDKEGVRLLVAALEDKSKAIRHDSIKVLYEAGSRCPALIAPHLPVFLKLLQHKDNRLQWGAMTAVAAIVPAVPDAVFAALPAVITAAEHGSVITKDQCMYILTGLAALPDYHSRVMPLLLEQLLQALPNQLPMYAEMVQPLTGAAGRTSFENILVQRLPDLEKESKKKRLEKILKQLSRS